LFVYLFFFVDDYNFRGKAVLNQKSELQRALQKQREVQSRKEIEKERLSTRSALEITLEKRAQRLEEVFIHFDSKLHSLKCE
jgi:Protein of unknown function (DUF1151)